MTLAGSKNIPSNPTSGAASAVAIATGSSHVQSTAAANPMHKIAMATMHVRRSGTIRRIELKKNRPFDILVRAI